MKYIPTIALRGSIYEKEAMVVWGNAFTPGKATVASTTNIFAPSVAAKAEILIVSSYPPRECGIATYTQDLIKALNNKFSNSLAIKVCALENGTSGLHYTDEVKYVIRTSLAADFEKIFFKINRDQDVRIVLIQHEFGFFKNQEAAFLNFLSGIKKSVIVAFHTVLPKPDEVLKTKIKNIAAACESLVVMTNNSAAILENEYGIDKSKISVIAHGTHLVMHLSEKFLKNKYGLQGRRVLTTFGLLGSGKSIETTLDALPGIIKTHPEVVFLIIGKTHPEVVKAEGEKYRDMLIAKVEEYKLQNHVRFINSYLPLSELLEYLQLTDIYLFTTNDPNQAVSGTFAYAMSCSCPIISTPIPHAKEVLTNDTGIIFGFRDSVQLTKSVVKLLNNSKMRLNMSVNSLQKIASTAWENSAVEYAMLFENLAFQKMSVKYNIPEVKLSHLKKMTTKTGIIQFSKINQPDKSTGYTLDDNARALIAICMNYNISRNKSDLKYIRLYLNFIEHCLQPDGKFLNYIDINRNFTSQNESVNLDDSSGRAIWALGYLISLKKILPRKISAQAESLLVKSLPQFEGIFSTRAMAFAVKGLYFSQMSNPDSKNLKLLIMLSDRLVQMYKHESDSEWLWFESYLTYANSILSEALLYAWKLTGNTVYRNIALSSFRFLLSQIFNENGIEVVSNKNWLQKGQKAGKYGEQPIDVAYTILTLEAFYDEFGEENFYVNLRTAFNWFLGKNRLMQIVYNPCTGGCYDGLEENQVNLNQGAESTLSYLMARLSIQKYIDSLSQTMHHA